MNVGYALLLSALAGLFTTVGSFLGIVYKNPGPRFLSLSLGFSAGVMILVSFVELLQKGIEVIGFVPAHLAFFGGFILMFLIDALIPHNYLAEHCLGEDKPRKTKLLRAGFFVAVGIGIHNFPEGLATFAGALQSMNLGVAIAVAVAIHNIPEGLAVSVPVYAATRDRRKAFLWSFLSGVSEPIGAGIAALFFIPFLNEALLGAILAVVAGIMVFISIDELVPSSRCYGHEHLSILGLVSGMMVMAASLWLLKGF